MANRAARLADRTARSLLLLAALACCGPAPAGADDGGSSSDSELRALSGSDGTELRAGDGSVLRGLSRPDHDHDPAARVSATPIMRPDMVDAAALSRAVAAGNQMSRQLTTPEEDDAGNIGGALLAIAGLVLAVVVISRFNSTRE
jgi:hypothetical protein